MNPFIAFIAITAAYACGTLPSALLIARAKGVDITTFGSGNPGASNVARAIGWKYGIWVFILDAAKGAIPVLLCLGYRPVAYTCAAAAIAGHVYPVTRNFKGGKGVATGAGVLLPLHPLVMIAAGTFWVITMKLSKKASVASIAVVPALILVLFLVHKPMWEILSFVAIGGLIELRHISNIKRLISGSEPPVTDHSS